MDYLVVLKLIFFPCRL